MKNQNKIEELQTGENGNTVDVKLTYISRFFSKTSHKIYEHYVITRIWHLLNNDDVEVIGQQCVKKDGKYFLTDIYFPQFNFHIEINEPYHYEIEKVESDKRRNESIINISGHKIEVIDCTKSIGEIHKKIDSIVDYIKCKISEQQNDNSFKPWNPSQNQNALYWKGKGIINSGTDKIHLRTVEDICALFEADFNKTKRGFLRKGGVPHPENKNFIIWWPSNKTRQNWQNEYINETQIMYEKNKNEVVNKNHLKKLIDADETRIMFYKDTDDFLGFTFYRYKGIYKLDVESSEKEERAVWKKIGNVFNLKTLEIS